MSGPDPPRVLHESPTPGHVTQLMPGDLDWLGYEATSGLSWTAAAMRRESSSRPEVEAGRSKAQLERAEPAPRSRESLESLLTKPAPNETSIQQNLHPTKPSSNETFTQ
ncbi:uncharacterized protein V6R79_025408 [Siganus canaliculatus]